MPRVAQHADHLVAAGLVVRLDERPRREPAAARQVDALDRAHAGHPLDPRLELAAIERRPEREAIGIEEPGHRPHAYDAEQRAQEFFERALVNVKDPEAGALFASPVLAQDEPDQDGTSSGADPAPPASADPSDPSDPPKADPGDKPAGGTPAVKGDGVLSHGAKPPCEIFVDGRNTGLRTPQREIKLSAGRHKITLLNNEFGIKESFSVDIKAGETAKMVKDFSDRITQ